MDAPVLLSVEQLAARLLLNKHTIYHWLLEQPELLPPAYRLRAGGKIVFRAEDVEQFVNEKLLPYRPHRPQQPAAVPAAGRRRGRPTKAEQLARARAGGAV